MLRALRTGRRLRRGERPESDEVGMTPMPTTTLRPRLPVSSSSDSTAIGGMTHQVDHPGGTGRLKESTATMIPASGLPLYVAQKSPEAMTVAVTDFLAALRHTGSERVLGALALALAEGMDASSAYAKGKLARELREILADLSKAERSPANLSLLEGVDV